jgi:hypothetical protein
MVIRVDNQQLCPPSYPKLSLAALRDTREVVTDTFAYCTLLLSCLFFMVIVTVLGIELGLVAGNCSTN